MFGPMLRSDGRHVMDTIRARMHKGSVAALNLYSLNLQNDLLGCASRADVHKLRAGSLFLHVIGLCTW
jgi:hypothetical protein